MVWIIIRSLLFGVLGLIVTPVAAFFVTLAIAYAANSSCGTPGDSGGCEMGAASIALITAVPGFLAGFVISLIKGLRGRSAR